VRRRAAGLREKLEADLGVNTLAPHEKMDWVSLFAIAVNEENAVGERVVTAPRWPPRGLPKRSAAPMPDRERRRIAMEHHLGMTCDPIGGLVQIPCIERNAFGAAKAISAASLARRGDGTHRVSLDHVIATMRQTCADQIGADHIGADQIGADQIGADMMTKYKETSQGGLAANFIEC
jgi:L-serine deaminase